MSTPKDILATLKPQADAIMERIGLDPADPTTVEMLEDPCDFETFNARLDMLMRRAQGRLPE